MENTIAKMLEEEIVKTLEDVAKVQAGTEEAKAALMKLEKLQAQRIDELEMALKENKRIDDSYAAMQENAIRKAELENKIKQLEMESTMREAELEQKDAELKEAKKTRRWKTVLDILGIGAPIAAGAYWMHRGMQFEEEGKVYTSRTMQWISSHLRLFGRKG